jgi:hypothetical protein
MVGALVYCVPTVSTPLSWPICNRKPTHLCTKPVHRYVSDVASRGLTIPFINLFLKSRGFTGTEIGVLSAWKGSFS